MKNIKIWYWISTLLFAAFMIFSAIPDIAMEQETKNFIVHLGYPEYFIPFIGVAKLMGSLTILIPSFKKLKEWAYAGLFFDLIGAAYSNIMVDGFHPSMLVLLVVLAFFFTSYFTNDKLYGDNTQL